MKQGNRDSCSCDECRAGCEQRPGWFKPGEAEKAAELLGVGMKTFFRTRLAIDYWMGKGGEEHTFLLAPAIVGEAPGREYPTVPKGRCTFYKGGLCEIHAAKPFECKRLLHGEGEMGAHKEAANAWRGEHQKQVMELLGREPETCEGDPMAYLSLMMDILGSEGHPRH